jgi:hypothetical protein
MTDVDALRQELKRLGYLTQGIERWFGQDPLSSRTFWAELLLLAAKSAALLCLFVAAPYFAVMLLRNDPLGAGEAVVLALLYSAASFALIFGVVVLAAAAFKLRPHLAVESPRTLTAISVLLSAGVSAVFGLWWLGFGPADAEWHLLAALVLVMIAFALGARVIFAALLSFSIHETQTIPATRRRSAALPIAVGAVLVALVVVVPLWSRERRPVASAPANVAVRASNARVALVAVDGLTHELFAARGGLRQLLPAAVSAPLLPHDSAPEVWATIGTGTPPSLHRVHAIEGVRLAGSSRVLQSVSRADFVLRRVGPALRVAQLEPLPPTERERDYVWEIVAARGVPSAAINWWTSGSSAGPNLISIPQSTVFRSARGEPLERAVTIDGIVARELASRPEAQLVTGYLPALDIILNRLNLDAGSRLTASVRVLEALERSIVSLRRGGYEVVVVGVPGSGQSGAAVVASSIPLRADLSLPDVAPTVLNHFGFPASEEMPGRSDQDRIASYGARGDEAGSTTVDPEYYESLRSLGYIQ